MAAVLLPLGKVDVTFRIYPDLWNCQGDGPPRSLCHSCPDWGGSQTNVNNTGELANVAHGGRSQRRGHIGGSGSGLS